MEAEAHDLNVSVKEQITRILLLLAVAERELTYRDRECLLQLTVVMCESRSAYQDAISR
jgi:hypothetical protein